MSTLLIVDDNTSARETLVAMLEGESYQIELAQDGLHALQMLSKIRPDLILLDVMMPGMDGPSTLRALRNLPKLVATPVVFMTAKVQPQEIAEYRAMGVLDVIAKPFDPMTLAETILAIWERYWLAKAVVGSAGLSDTFASSLPDKLIAVDAVWEQLRRSWDAEALARLYRLVHSLHGTGATVGFGDLSTAARGLDETDRSNASAAHHRIRCRWTASRGTCTVSRAYASTRSRRWR